MLFNSMAFAIFLPIVFILYWALPHRYRWVLLWVASYYFYMSWNAKYVVLILLTTVVSYFAAVFIDKVDDKKSKKAILAVALIICLGILFTFKYFNFFTGSVAALLQSISIPVTAPVLNLVLPVGISFYTFQTLSYVIDVYRGDVKPEKNFGIYATFISFFPQLVAGPIERTRNLLPQIKAEHRFDYDKAVRGAELMLIGFYKKLVIADSVSKYVDYAYADIHSHSGLDLIIIIFFFTMQIYCDFSGYSDIAIGTASLMGIDLMTNFKSPYFSASVKEFWSRWHISLSTWFKDYVYIPLGGNRCSFIRRNINLLITFLVSGLWHGANWTFVLWGLLHGMAQIIENLFDKQLKRVRNNKIGHWISVFVVFAFCNIAWVFFRASSLSDAVYVVTHILSGIGDIRKYLHCSLGLDIISFSLILVPVLGLAVFDYFNFRDNAIERISRLKKGIQWGIYIAIGLLVIFISQKGVAAEFVYFQF